MAGSLGTGTARFGLLHFSPYPERGDRVCVGIWFDDGRRVSVDYDERFHQLRCIAPGLDVKFVRLLLEDLDQSLRKAGPAGAEAVMRQYEPQLVSTEARKILVPLTPAIQEQLRKKFLLSSRELAAIDRLSAPSQRASQDEVAEHVKDYVRALMPNKQITMRERVTPYTLFGTRSQIKIPTIAVAVEQPHKFILIDGVDLTVLTAKRAVAKVDQIVYAFWQFGRATEDRTALFPSDRSLQRVGIVLNGSSRRNPASLEAHDYAIDRFHSEAEVTVDATTNEGRDELIATLNE